MCMISKKNLEKNALRDLNRVASSETISAAKFYMGVPDGYFFTYEDFEESVVNAKKAYITLNTIMGGDTAEMDRFCEGKKQIPEILTPLGVKKMVKLYTILYSFGISSSKDIEYETVRACRQSEVSEGEFIVEALTSTTKLSVDEIMALGYGNKNNLAICCYKFHKGAAVFDMEDLGKDYLKPEEREVLILTGTRLVAKGIGYDSRYLGKDGKPGLVYNLDVYPPKFSDIEETQEELESVVYDSRYIAEVKSLYNKLNTEQDFPIVPECYKEWKAKFKKLVFLELKKITN